MSNNIQVPSLEQLSEKSQGVLNNVKKSIGVIPNLYATIGYSGDTLANYLTFDAQAGASSFNKKELEVIKLAVSEVNDCSYCLAAHTLMGKGAGLSEEETVQARTAELADERLNILATIAREISERRGHISNATLESFLNAGFDQAALIDLVAAVTTITFTNLVHGVTQVPVDFPAAPSLAIA